MKHNRWFYWVVAGALLVLAIVTIQQLGATAQVVSANKGQESVTHTDNVQNPFACPFTPQQIRSIHPEFIKGLGQSLPFTKDGPTGVEGGLYMLRYCNVP